MARQRIKSKYIEEEPTTTASDEPAPVRVPIGDPLNEAMVIAAVVNSQRARTKYLQSIAPDNFYADNNVLIWASLQELHRRRLEFSPEALRQIAGPKLDLAYLNDVLAGRDDAATNADFHVERLQWDRARVEMARGPLAQFLESLRDATVEPERLRGLLSTCLESLSGYGSQQFIRSAKALAIEQDAEMTLLRQGRAVYPSGIDGLDFYGRGEQFEGQPRLTPNLYPGMFTVVTGVSGSGKSTSTAWATLQRAKQKRSTLYGAWEVKSGMTLRILACMDLCMHRTDVQEGNFTEETQRKIVERMEELDPYIKFFELPFGKARGERQYNDRALDLMHQVIADSGCEVFVADLARRAMKETRVDDEEQFLYRLQAIGQETRCHIITVQQQKSKEVEATKSKLPRRDLIKGSSAWVEVADTIVGWHNPALWKDVPADRLIALVLKQRYGRWPFAVEIDYDSDHAQFKEGREVTFRREEDEEQNEGDAFLDQGYTNKRTKGRRT